MISDLQSISTIMISNIYALKDLKSKIMFFIWMKQIFCKQVCINYDSKWFMSTQNTYDIEMKNFSEWLKKKVY